MKNQDVDTARYPEAKFGGFTDIDGTVAFFSRVNALLTSESIVLDVGCGRGAYVDDPIPFRRDLCVLRGKAAKVIGIDIDQAGEENPCLDEFCLVNGGQWPIDSNSVDLIVCDNVLEHVEDPASVFSEFRRVLRSGGHLCVRTPNRWSYISLVSRLVPNRYHSSVTAFAQSGRKEQDVFPTLYRCNTIATLRRYMHKAGFRESVVYGYEAEPRYAAFSRIVYYLCTLHQRFAPGFLKPSIFAYGRLTK